MSVLALGSYIIITKNLVLSRVVVGSSRHFIDFPADEVKGKEKEGIAALLV